ncbi:glycosyltransferase family 2 protein (plasmid) [Microvirga sp. RSM25]|uniref:glycosyltransferase family 2 protein n=1 Tax=Microvirga sp. RSM25 TaxID=3273802 RepID=UPI00384D96A1
MRAHLNEVFEIGGAIIGLICVSGGSSKEHSYRFTLEQNGVSVGSDAKDWIRINGPSITTAKRGPGSRPSSVRLRSRSGIVYLTIFGGDASTGFSTDRPVHAAVHAGTAEVWSGIIEMGTIDPARLLDRGFRLALHDALQAVGMPEITSVLQASPQIRSVDDLTPIRIECAIRANSGLVLRGRATALAGRDLHIVTADLRRWLTSGQTAVHAVDETVTEATADRQSDAVDSSFTAVLPTTGMGNAESIYVVEVDPTGAEAIFHGPWTVTGVDDEPEAVRLVRDTFGPIQSLPETLIRDVYRPILARPKMSACARRFEFGPAVDQTKPLSSIIIPFYGDAFFLNCVYHLQRILGPGFELVLVVDDPRIWPEIYGRLSARQSSITVPTVLLQCASNYGYARANNLGFTAARGDVIFLMNSDILVLNPTTLNEAADAIRARQEFHQPEAVIGFSLLYEDDTIQHIGMEFPRSRLMGDLRLADHPMKGLPFASYRGACPSRSRR